MDIKGLKKVLLTVEPPIITPQVVKPGDKVKQELQFALLSPDEGKYFNVSETVVLSSGKDTFELIRRSSEKPQGIHLSTIQFTIPSDLERGEYILTTTLSIGEQMNTTSGRFNMEKKF